MIIMMIMMMSMMMMIVFTHGHSGNPDEPGLSQVHRNGCHRLNTSSTSAFSAGTADLTSGGGGIPGTPGPPTWGHLGIARSLRDCVCRERVRTEACGKIIYFFFRDLRLNHLFFFPSLPIVYLARRHNKDEGIIITKVISFLSF
jgi:hypothetical protein